MAKKPLLRDLIDQGHIVAGKLGGVAVHLGTVQGTGKRSDQLGESYYNASNGRVYNVYGDSTVSYKASPDTVNAKFRGKVKQDDHDATLLQKFLDSGAQAGSVTRDGELTNLRGATTPAAPPSKTGGAVAPDESTLAAALRGFNAIGPGDGTARGGSARRELRDQQSDLYNFKPRRKPAPRNRSKNTPKPGQSYIWRY